MDALRIMVNLKKVFMKKKKRIINVLTVLFLIFHKSGINFFFFF